VCTIFIPIYSLQETVFSKTIYAFLCYKFSITITRILVKIEVFNNNIVLIRNDYFVYTVKEIKKDLENMKLHYSDTSGLDIDFSTEKKRTDNVVQVLGYIILETSSLKFPALPMSYNSELYEKLYFLNDHNSSDKKKKLEDIVKNLPEITQELTTFVYTSITDETLGRYFHEICNNTFLLTDEWFFKEQ
jgi:ABC-type antimicrobial peptide transport system permease subunit